MNYREMGPSYDQAVKAFRKNRNYRDYYNECIDQGYEPLRRKLFKKVKRDCQKEIEVNMTLKRRLQDFFYEVPNFTGECFNT